MVNKWSKVWLVVGAAIALTAIPYLIFWERLPEPMASHWGPASQPDGSMPRWAGLATTAALVLLIGGGLSMILARHSDGRREPSPESLALTGFIGALAIGLSWVSIFLNLDAGSWQEAAAMPPWLVLAVVAAALGGGLMGYRVGRSIFPIPAGPLPRAPVTEVLPGENAAWVGSATSRGQLLAIVPGVVALTLFPSPFRWLGLLFVVLGVLLSRVVARGDGIIVTLDSGRRFAVTVDDAATGAGLLNGLVGRIRSA